MFYGVGLALRGGGELLSRGEKKQVEGWSDLRDLGFIFASRGGAR